MARSAIDDVRFEDSTVSEAFRIAAGGRGAARARPTEDLIALIACDDARAGVAVRTLTALFEAPDAPPAAAADVPAETQALKPSPERYANLITREAVQSVAALLCTTVRELQVEGRRSLSAVNLRRGLSPRDALECLIVLSRQPAVTEHTGRSPMHALSRELFTTVEEALSHFDAVTAGDAVGGASVDADSAVTVEDAACATGILLRLAYWSALEDLHLVETALPPEALSASMCQRVSVLFTHPALSPAARKVLAAGLTAMTNSRSFAAAFGRTADFKALMQHAYACEDVLLPAVMFVGNIVARDESSATRLCDQHVHTMLTPLLYHASGLDMFSLVVFVMAQLGVYASTRHKVSDDVQKQLLQAMYAMLPVLPVQAERGGTAFDVSDVIAATAMCAPELI